MAKYLHLEIPKNCHENWSNMHPNADGSFCNSCQKTVIDFTGMSDNDLVAFFKTNNKNVCGRFSPNQLQRDIKEPAKKINWLRYVIHFTIPALLISLKSTAQLLKSTPQTEIGPINQKKDVAETKQAEKFIATGRVVDAADMPLAGASVVIKGTQKGTLTDNNGEFSIKCPDSLTILEVSYVGHQTQEFTSGKAKNNTVVFKMEHSFMGDVVVTRSRKRKAKAKKLSPLISSAPTSATIFPNPINPNTNLNIRWKYPTQGNYEIQILNQNGQLFQTASLKIETNTEFSYLLLNKIPTGVFIVSIKNTNSGKGFSQQLVID